MSLRAFARNARRAAGLMKRTVKVQHVNRLTGLTESREVTHSLSATGFIRGEGGRIESVRQPNRSKPGAGSRAAIRASGGGKAHRRSKIATRRALRGIEACSERNDGGAR